MSETKDDQELRAIQQVIAALSDLDSEARARVINYVFQRLGISSPAALVESGMPGVTPAQGMETRAAVAQPGRRQLAPADERKVEISAKDITKYFKQAGFPLPGAARMTLVNAKNAGYLDAGAERGAYKLNPVGHNLVAHSLPAATATGRASGRGNRKRARKSKKVKKSGSRR
jgi:hypothetical protein